jgi:DNA-binding NtrC family response regulator
VLLSTVQEAIRLQPQNSAHNTNAKADIWRKKIISRSAVMSSLLQQNYHVAQSDFSLLIHGASVTVKISPLLTVQPYPNNC